MSTVTIKLTGDSLVRYAEEHKEQVLRGELTRTDLIKDAGYVRDNGSAEYTEYYTELLRARGELPVTDKDVEETSYENLSGADQDFYDKVDEMFGEKWDHEMVLDFMEELKDLGIETPEALQDSFEYQSDSYRAERDFAEELITQIMGETIPSAVEGCIDWEAVWESSLRYDYNTIEFDGEVFFFRNI
jgi:hypothetical protein